MKMFIYYMLFEWTCCGACQTDNSKTVFIVITLIRLAVIFTLNSESEILPQEVNIEITESESVVNDENNIIVTNNEEEGEQKTK